MSFQLSWFQKNLNNPTFRSFVVALASMSSVMIVNHPQIKARFLFLQKFFIARVIVLFVLIFSSQAALDMAIKFKDKSCEFIDSMSIALAGMVGFLLFYLLTKLPATRYKFMQMEMTSPTLFLILMSLIVGLIVFLWKRFGRLISKRAECSPC